MSAAPTISRSEAAAAPRAAASPADAIRDLYERHQRRILAYCVSRLRDRQEAEDAVQNTFVYAFKLLERGVVPHAELPWLFTIAHNVCRSRKRALWRRGRVEASTDLDSYQDVFSAPDRAEADDLSGLSGALASMPETQRRALLLREWQGLSYAEIAATLSLSQSAVETLLFRARRNLAKQLTAGYDRVAVMLNGFVLVRLGRRLLRAGVGTKATAAVVAAGVVAGAGIPLVHDLGRRPSSPAPTTAAAIATPAATVVRAAAAQAFGPASLPLRRGRADVAAAGAVAPIVTIAQADAVVAQAPSTTLPPKRPSPAAASASVTASTSDGGRGTVLGTQIQTPVPPVLPQQPIRHTVKQATSAVSKTVSQVGQTVSQTESTASQVVAQADSTVSEVAGAVGVTVPTSDTTTTTTTAPTATPPAPVAAVQQTVTDVANTATDAASQLLGHTKTP